jgi:predicted nucleotidyltransferase
VSSIHRLVGDREETVPTALELAREEWLPYVEAARRRPPPPELTATEREARELLLERVRKAAVVLKTRFRARRVVLLGSLAHAAWFEPRSDVDLVVEGLAGGEYWRAWRAVEAIIGDRPVDLIEIETAGQSLQGAVQRYGVEL